MHNNFIFQDYVADLALCDEIVTYHSEVKQHPGEIVLGQTSFVDKTVKASMDAPLGADLKDRYLEELRRISRAYVARYEDIDLSAPWGITTNPNIQKYEPNEGYFKWHCERDSAADAHIASRYLVYMTYLNDVTDGGETEFKYQDLKVQPKKGLTLLWPVDWTHTHRGLPSPTQTKYIVTGWFCFV